MGEEKSEKWGAQGHLDKFQKSMRGLVREYNNAGKLSDAAERIEAQRFVREEYQQNMSRALNQSGLSQSDLITSVDPQQGNLRADLPEPLLPVCPRV